MIRSMTAFARRESQGPWGNLTLELRAVNHRFLELSVRLPEELRAFEPMIRERIGRALSRGKVDCNVRYQSASAFPEALEVNRELASRLAHVSREVDALLYNPAPVNSLDVLKWPGVLQVPSPDPEQLKRETQAALDTALEDMRANREREGEKLKTLILQRCDGVAAIVAQVRTRVPEVVERYRERLRHRLAEVAGELDEGRVEQEMVLLAQRMDVDEEMDRLGAHLGEVRNVLERDEPVGRRLDFLMQELNREANTLGSKSMDAETTRASVDLKVLIEQMREQIQNIE